MSKSSSSKGKRGGQGISTKASSHKPGDVLDSQKKVMSRDPNILKQYLKLVLSDDEIHQNKEKWLRQIDDNHLQPNNDLSSYLADIVNRWISYLPTKFKTEGLLDVARTCGILADDINDSLVKEAGNLLPSSAYRALADYLIHEAQQLLSKSTSCDASEAGAALVSYLSDNILRHPDMTRAVWKAFLSVSNPTEQVCIFKHLIHIGVKQFIPTATDTDSQVFFHPGLEFLLTSEDSVDGLALLLQDEVQQSKDQPACFFSSTELGSLLSLNTVIQRDTEAKTFSIEGFLSDILYQIKDIPYDEKVFGGIIDTVQQHVSRMIQAVTTALINILKSNIKTNQGALTTWMRAVIFSNRHHRIQITQNRSPDSYMMTFCAVLLRIWRLFAGKLTKSINFNRYYPSEDSLDQEDENTLAGAAIDSAGESSHSSWTETQIEEELFLCCQQAVSVCLSSALHRFLMVNAQELIKLEEEPNHIKSLLRLDEMTMWDEGLHGLVAMLYVDHCQLLLQLLGETEVQGSRHDAELKLTITPQILRILIEDMAGWIFALSTMKKSLADMNRYRPALDKCLDLCFYLLGWRQFTITSSPALALALIRMLHLFASSVHRQEWIINRVLQQIEQVLPSLFTIYTRHEFAERVTLSGRSYLVCLLNECWHKPQFQKNLHKKCETEVLQEFLTSFLQTLQGLVGKCKAALQIHLEKACRMKPILFQGLEYHTRMLCTLADDDLIRPMLIVPPTNSHTYSTISCMADVVRDLDKLNNSEVELPSLKEELKSLIGKSIQVLHSIVSIRDAASSNQPQIHSPLIMLKEGPFISNEGFTNITETIKKLDIPILQNQGRRNVQDESWMAECLNTHLDEDALLEAFHTLLRNSRLCTAPLLQSHSFKEIAKDTNLKPETKTLVQWEIQRLQKTFPCNPSSALFIILDKDRVDVMRCAMSGPSGTPYSRGLFVFDIFCPADYPSVPPKVKLLSTVDGAVFFGPHVKNNEVSLISLRGKFTHGNSGHWSIAKVSHLLKNMMLSAMKETAHDESQCTDGRSRLVCQVRAQTVRHAMLEPLKNPPVGVERVVGLYFVVQQQALLKQCARWRHDCPEEIETFVSSLYNVMQGLSATILQETRDNDVGTHLPEDNDV